MKWTRKHLLTLILLAVVVLAGLFFLWPRGPREPVYQGKSINQWREQVVGSISPEESKAARAAFDAIGTNAVPFLLHEFTRPISRWPGRVNRWADQVPSLNIHLRRDVDRIDDAATCLLLLGTNAALAVPVLLGYLDDPVRCSYAGMVIGSVGHSAVPHLTAAVSSTEILVASNALVASQKFGYASGQARAVCAVALRHPDPGLRAAAVKAWGIAEGLSEEVVPDLLKLAHDPSPRVVLEASNQLARLIEQSTERIGDAARAALLTLRTNAPLSPK